MAATKPRKRLSVLKRIRQTVTRNLRNKGVRSEVKTFTRKVLEALGTGEKGKVQEALREATKVISSAASKGALHRNTASRKISRLARKANTVQ